MALARKTASPFYGRLFGVGKWQMITKHGGKKTLRTLVKCLYLKFFLVLLPNAFQLCCGEQKRANARES
ncbi:hypothetical protein QUC31_014946 [Theobroma cacao]